MSGSFPKHFSNMNFSAKTSEKAMAPHSSTLPGKSHGRRSLAGYTVHGVTESRND